MTQSTSNSNAPGGLPFTPQDALEFMQKVWNPFGVQLPGSGVPPTAGPGTEAASGAAPGMAHGFPFPNPAAMFAAIDPKEVQRKIDEMRVIEGWLQMTLNMMQMSIKTMELQKASLEALRGRPAADAGSKATRSRGKS